MTVKPDTVHVEPSQVPENGAAWHEASSANVVTSCAFAILKNVDDIEIGATNTDAKSNAAKLKLSISST